MLFIVIGLFVTLPVKGQNALETKITLDLRSVSLKEALVGIQKSSSVRLVYTQDINRYSGTNVTLVQKDVTVKAALGQVLQGTNLQFVQEDFQIIISEKPRATSPNGDAGQRPGSIKGRVVEFETSEPLPGASVRLVELNLGASTDAEGYYNLADVPAGRYTLQVSFISYATENVTVEVREGREGVYDVKLQGDNNVLNEVVVTGVAESRAPVAHATERQVLSEIKNAQSVVSGISSEQISRSADRNAAQVLQRVSGVSIVDDRFVIVRGLNPRYNLTYLNDNVAPSTEVNSRSFALDLIPSRIIDKIMVYKSPSPENQGDATGGVIKIYTKDAKAVKHFDVELQLGWRERTTFSGNFLTYNGGKTDWLGVDDGARALPKILPDYGSLMKAQLTPSQYAKAMNPTLSYNAVTALPNMQITANYYNAFKVGGKPLSSLTSISYKSDYQRNVISRQEGAKYNSAINDEVGTDDQNLSTVQINLLQNFAYTIKPGHVISLKNFFLQQGADATVVADRFKTYFYRNWEVFKDQRPTDRDITLSFRQRFLYAGNLGGTHAFGDAQRHGVRWNGGYTFSRQDTPDQRVIRLDNRDYNKDWAIIADGYQARNFGKSSGSGSDADNYYTLSKGIISRMWSRNSEGVYNGSVDYSYRLTPWLSAAAGTFHQWKERTLYRRVYTVQEAAIENVDNPWTSIDSERDNEQLTGFFSWELPQVWSETYLNDNYNGLAVNDRTRGSDTYIASEQNNSGYALLRFTPAHRLVEISGGLRYEYNRQKIAAAIPPDTHSPGGVNMPIMVDRPMRTWLPSVNFSLRPTDQWVLRAAYGKTVNRTEFREVSPFQELDFENNTIIQGSPDLISATASNYDVRLEFYPQADKSSNTISVGAFYKDIANPIERINTTNRVASYFNLISFRNATSATLKGLEVEARQSLDFIPLRFFRNLSLAGNASIIRSQATFEGLDPNDLTIAERPLQGQAPYLVNAGLYYDNAGTGTKLAVIYNTAGENIYAAGLGYRYNSNFGISEYRGSLIELPRHLLDLSVMQRIGKGLQAKLTVQNLFDQAIRVAEDANFNNTYEKLTEVTRTDEKGEEVMANDGDNIYSSFKPGRYVNLSLSYSF